MLSLLAHLAEAVGTARGGTVGPHLIVAPFSVIENWRDEWARATSNPALAGAASALRTDASGAADSLHIHHGLPAERAHALKAFMRDQLQRQRRAGSGKQPTRLPTIVVTTYELAMRDVALLRSCVSGWGGWSYLVVDEGHRLKNRNARLGQQLSKLNVARRLLLTGTPLQVSTESAVQSSRIARCLPP